MEATSSSASYSIETTIVSAESLTLGGKKPLRGNPYVVISTMDTDQASKYHLQQFQQQCRTKVCKENESNAYPAWNEKLTMDVPIQVKFLVLEVRCCTRSGDKTIGVAKVPVSDFIGNSNLPINYLHFLSYRLRDGYGDPNGIINFSVKVVKAFDYNQYSPSYKHAGHWGAPKIEGFGYGNCVPMPWHGTSLVGHHGTSSSAAAAAVGVPATWLHASNLHVNL